LTVNASELAVEDPSARTVSAVSKVPEITVFFWVTKVLTTGMGEAASDYLGARLGTAIAMPLAVAGLVVALIVQFRVRRYIAWVYWSAVVAVSVLGTMLADGIHNGPGVPYVVSTIVFGLALGAVFLGWRRSEKSLNVHTIYTRRREGFYWATVVATFALGTAAGDMTAESLHLGYILSVVIFAAVIAIPAVAHWRFGMNPVLAFWFAYVVTRPLGASFADWMAVPRHQGGVGLGTGWVTLLMTVAIAGFVGYLAITRADVDRAVAT
jgi:uncharacterized membrane-anchored protein